MDKKDLKVFIGIVLREHPDVFPSRTRIRNLLRMYGIRSDARSVLSSAVINRLKAEWIANCSDDGRFLECINNHGTFSHVNEKTEDMIHKRFVAICERLCEESKVFPASNKIAALIKDRYKVNVSDLTVAAHLDLPRMQKRWISRASCVDFLTACSKAVFSSVSQSVKLAVNERFLKITKKVLSKDEFPTVKLITKIISEKYGLNISRQLVRNHVDVASLQEEWVKKSSTEIFLQNLKYGKTRYIDRAMRKKIEERFATICMQLCAEKKVFPTYCTISRLLMERYKIKMKDSSIGEKIDIAESQIDWIRTAITRDFLNVLKTGVFFHSRKKVRAVVNERFEGLARQLCQGLDKFPSFSAISKTILKEYDIKIDPATIALLNVLSVQIDWIKNCSDKVFLQNLHVFKCAHFHPEIKSAIAAREMRIVDENAMKNDYLKFVRKKSANDSCMRSSSFRTTRYKIARRPNIS